MKIGAVILAAGYSSRMDGFKPLKRLGDKSLLAHCTEHFRKSGISSIMVVTGHRGEEVESEASRLGLNWYRNQEYDQGMFSSICGAVKQLQQLDCFFLLPVDIPLIYPATITCLLNCFDGHSVLIPVFNGEQGHPPLIPASLIPTILHHDGHGGLRSILEKQQVKEIPVWDRGILMDADTPQDFAALEQRLHTIGIGEQSEAIELANMFMPEKGIDHGRAVANVARKIGARLNNRGYTLNPDLIHNAALLHDIGKGTKNHELRGAEILRHLGLDNLAEIVAAHRCTPPPASGVLTEKEIVCLADKLVKGSHRVCVRKRFTEKLNRYANDPEAIKAIRQRLADTLALQAEVEQQVERSIIDIFAEEGWS